MFYIHIVINIFMYVGCSSAFVGKWRMGHPRSDLSAARAFGFFTLHEQSEFTHGLSIAVN